MRGNARSNSQPDKSLGRGERGIHLARARFYSKDWAISPISVEMSKSTVFPGNCGDVAQQLKSLV